MKTLVVKSSQVWKVAKIHQLEWKLESLRQRRLRGQKRLEQLVVDMKKVTQELRKLKEETECRNSEIGCPTSLRKQ